MPGTHWIGGSVGSSAGLDDMENRKCLTLAGLQLRPLGRPTRRRSLHRLRHRGSFPLTGRAVKLSINTQGDRKEMTFSVTSGENVRRDFLFTIFRST
jgi:hypothetical protein